LSHPFRSRNTSSSASFFRVNGKIRAREVRVVDAEGKQLGVMPTSEAIGLARSRGVDLVEIAPQAEPPVCKLVEYGKFKYEQSKRDKESRKHQHANEVKEIQLSVRIDEHDLKVKAGHAIGFLCDDMKVKVNLRFRGREMAHTEFGFQVIERFLNEISAYGHSDFQPKLNGRHINLMISPLPKNKRPAHPKVAGDSPNPLAPASAPKARTAPIPIKPAGDAEAPAGQRPATFTNNPFAEIGLGQG
jgi:translation initiation factor IF-3